MNYNNKTYMLPSWCVSFPSPAYRRPCVSLPFSMLVLSGVEWSGVTHIARKGTREKSTRGGHALQILHVAEGGSTVHTISNKLLGIQTKYKPIYED